MKTKKMLKNFLFIFMGLFIAFFIAGSAFLVYIVINADEFDEEKLYRIDSSVIYDVNGNEIKKLGVEKRKNVTYDDLPDVFIDALLATEDARFFIHNGVDIPRLLKATLDHLKKHSDAGGASTLAMQIIKQNLTSNETKGFAGITRKLTDIYLAVFKLEKEYSKEEIIALYVNVPYLGSGAWGIEQACQVYFSKSASELTLPEAALIAGLFQAPDSYDPYQQPEKAEARKNQVLTLMLRHNYITDEEHYIAKKVTVASMLTNTESNPEEFQGVWDTVVAEVKERTGLDPYVTPMKIYSTFNMEKQKELNGIYNSSFKYQSSTYKWPDNKLQAAVAVIDVNTGGIAAIGAGRNRKGELSYNYATMIKRHPGSTAKPIFDYGPAIEYLGWNANTLLVDAPHAYSDGTPIRNFDYKYYGSITLSVALGASRNIPAVKTFQALKQKQINTFVTGLGITPEYDQNGYINEAHSIGGFSGVSPVELAAAYATFARGGEYIEPHSVTKIEFIKTGEIYTVIPEKRTAMKPSTAKTMNSILTAAVNNGYINAGKKAGTDIASKTGTSTVDEKFKKKLGIKANINGDSWQVVYSPDYAFAVWIGYNTTTKTQYLKASTGKSTRKALSLYLTQHILEPNSRFEK